MKRLTEALLVVLASPILAAGFLVALTRKRPRTVMLSQKPPGTAPATVAGVMR